MEKGPTSILESINHDNKKISPSGPYRPFGLQARNFTFRRLTVFAGGRTFTSPHNRPNQKFQNHARRTFPHGNGHGDFNDI